MTLHRITIVNHCAIDILCPPSRVWATLVDDYAGGDGFARAGYRIDPLDEPALVLGGYRMRFRDDERVDERVCRITERDEGAMKLSLRADYLSADARGMFVYATYEVVPAGEGAVYRLDCHATLDWEVAEGASRADVAQGITELRNRFQDGIAGKASELKARLEAAKAA